MPTYLPQVLAALPRARDRLLYRLVLSDMHKPPDATSDMLLEGISAASPPGAGVVFLHDGARRVCYRDAALGLTLCAYLLFTTSFIVSFHLEQTQHDGAIADNKRVYVVARHPLLKHPL